MMIVRQKHEHIKLNATARPHLSFKASVHLAAKNKLIIILWRFCLFSNSNLYKKSSANIQFSKWKIFTKSIISATYRWHWRGYHFVECRTRMLHCNDRNTDNYDYSQNRLKILNSGTYNSALSRHDFILGIDKVEFKIKYLFWDTSIVNLQLFRVFFFSQNSQVARINDFKWIELEPNRYYSQTVLKSQIELYIHWFYMRQMHIIYNE